MLKTNDIKIIIKICKPSYSDLRSHERTVFSITETGGNYAVVPQRGPIPSGRLLYVIHIPEMQYCKLVKRNIRQSIKCVGAKYHIHCIVLFISPSHLKAKF